MTTRCTAASGSTITASVFPATTPAPWRARPVAQPFSPGITQTCTASPRPMAWASCPTTPACAGYARVRCRRWGTGFAPRVTTPTTTVNGTSRMRICTTPTGVCWRPMTPPVSSTLSRYSGISTLILLRRSASRVGSAPSRTVRCRATRVCAEIRWSPTASSLGSPTVMRAATTASRPRCVHSCWWPASSTRTTSCCSRAGCAAAR